MPVQVVIEFYVASLVLICWYELNVDACVWRVLGSLEVDA